MLRRLHTLVKIWLKDLLAPAQDPREAFAYSYERQRELLLRVQEALRHVRSAKSRLSSKIAELRAKLPVLQEQARRSLVKGNEDAARAALERRALAGNELQSLEIQLQEIELEEQRLSLVESRVSSQIEAFLARQEVIQARYSAAEAQVKIREALTGMSDELADLSNALVETEQKTEKMQARAFAIDRLVREGSLESPSSNLLEASSGDLSFMTLSSQVSEQLEQLREEVTQDRDGPGKDQESN
jgi:phage shock protein A